MIPQVGIRWSVLPFKNFAPVRAPLRILGDCHLAVSSGQEPLLSQIDHVMLHVMVDAV